jgi:transcriptional regulator with XRE-family HTH domain
MPADAADRERWLTEGVGAQVRKAREAASLSLRELARRIDVSPSLLSQIENGLARPSVGTLWALVGELDLSLDAVFGATREDAPGGELRAGVTVQRAGDRPVLELAGGVRWEQLGPDGSGDVVFAFVTYEPGSSFSGERPPARHGGREYGFVVSGRLEIEVGSERVVLGQGDSVSFVSHDPHRFRAVGDDAARAVWINVPPMS